MSRRSKTDVRLVEVPEMILSRARPPLGMLFGSPAELQNLHEALQFPETRCYQMDLYSAERCREVLGDEVEVVTAPDVWDLEGEFQTLIYLPPRQGERELKIDVVDQAFQLLPPKGRLIVWSPYQADDLFPGLLKKIFGKVSMFHEDDCTILIAQREKDRPRRRHEVTFQAKIGDGPSCKFISRPGIFSYGKFDAGARALMEVAEINEGDAVLDLGCGCGTNGVFAWQKTGSNGHIAFLDSNVRATALAEMNAQANGVTNYEVVTSAQVEGLSRGNFDVVLTNPPYFAYSYIARMFVERGLDLLKPGGKLYLVSRQPIEAGTILLETVGEYHEIEHRGYTIFLVHR